MQNQIVPQTILVSARIVRVQCVRAQLITPCFVRTDELDLSGQAEGFELAFDGLEAAPQVGRDAGGAKLPAVAQQFQDPLTPTRWPIFHLIRFGLGFPGYPNC
jgi:hypothetical protein